MSVKAMAWAWEQELKPGPKFVLVALADHADGSGICWPGHELIAEKCGFSRQTVVEHIGLLTSGGWVRAERTKDSKGREGKSRYFLQMDRLSMQPSESEVPTLVRVGNSADTVSVIPTPIKVEPKAIEPESPKPLLFGLDRKSLEHWFEETFWPLYPKRCRKAKALQVLLASAPDQVMLDAMREGLAHRVQAERQARAKGEWFRAWPDPHRWLKPDERRWEDRFDVAAAAVDKHCACGCGAMGVVRCKGRWWTVAHDPENVPRGTERTMRCAS